MRKSLTLVALWTTSIYPAQSSPYLSIIYGSPLAEKIKGHNPEAVQFVQKDTFDPVNSCCFINYPHQQTRLPIFRFATLSGNA